ncbi:MAG: 8-oxo-(d)GTP phosphatase [Actinomycetota bacterium]|jgi:8-oxo-dGTP diphosphatase|nr:8-oxo-(d)GTP phosphatase [Actinomycetota bacterium]
MTQSDTGVHAAGGLIRRQTDAGPEFCLVRRPKYLDWTLPKGKLEPGESHRDAAIREVGEETGFHCSVGPELPSVTYPDIEGRTKLVRYWLMTPTAGAFTPNQEVDELRWLPASEAVALLTYSRDRGVVVAALGLDTPVFLVRHGKAGSRSEWEEDDRLRPLSKAGREQAEAIARTLSDEGVTRIESSPYVRCVQTVRPLSLVLGVSVQPREELAEGEDVDGAWARVGGLREVTALCSHGDVIPAMIEEAEQEGAELPVTRECRKGSIWRLERQAGRVVAATYVPPA